jgi:signal transduction histidine kinase
MAALEWQAQGFQARNGIRCQFECAEERIELDADIAIALFRIFQEALTNVARHAHASSVRASLTRTGDKVFLRVQDNGQGFEDMHQAQRKSLGLLGMKERAVLVGGSLRLQSAPGQGTTVEAGIPISRKAPIA